VVPPGGDYAFGILCEDDTAAGGLYVGYFQRFGAFVAYLVDYVELLSLAHGVVVAYGVFDLDVGRSESSFATHGDEHCGYDGEYE